MSQAILTVSIYLQTKISKQLNKYLNRRYLSKKICYFQNFSSDSNFLTTRLIIRSLALEYFTNITIFML